MSKQMLLDVALLITLPLFAIAFALALIADAMRRRERRERKADDAR